MTRVLIAGQSYIVGESRKKLAHLAEFADLSLSLIVPRAWEHESFGRHEFQSVASDERVSIYPIPIRNNGRVYAFSYEIQPLARAINEIQPDIFQVEQEPGSVSLLQFAMFAALQRRSKLIAFSWENLHISQPRLRRILEKIELTRLDDLMVGSRTSAETFRKKGYHGRLTILPNVGVDPEVFSPRPNAALRERLGLGSFVVGFVGRLVYEKGCDDLIRAFSQLPNDCSLLFVGDGSERHALERLAHQLNVQHRVIFQSTVPHARVPDYLNCMSCLVLASKTMPNRWREQFGLVLAQAMSCGIPVIGSDCGAIPEVISDAGLLFPEGDMGALRDHLARLYHDTTLRVELGIKGRARVLANYTNQQIAVETYRIYQELMA